MITNIFIFIVSLILILGGANFLTDGSASLAKRFGMSPLIVGLTIVAFGTSAPELVVSLTSSINGYGDISVGNIIGSNIFNILAILGLTAIVKPVVVGRSTIKMEIPFMIIVFFTLLIMALDNLFSGLDGAHNYISRSEGIILLFMFSLFIAYNIKLTTVAKSIVLLDDEPKDDIVSNNKNRSMWIMILMIVGGISGLIWGGDMLVDSASSIARQLGVSDAIIGITLVAAGTSVPELATSVVAAYKKESDIAVGNIVGSCIFNVLLVLGVSSIVRPITVDGIGLFDFGVMILSSLLMLIFSVFYGDRIIKRGEGVILLLVFIAYYIMALV